MSKYSNRSVITLIVGLVLSVTIGCNPKNHDELQESGNDSSSQSSKNQPSQLPDFGTYNGDTINVFGPFVLFYGPEEVQGIDDNTSQTQPDLYAETRNRIIDSLNQKSKIIAAFTTVNCIRIYNAEGKSIIILRNTFPEQTGVILSDWNQSAAIKKGTFTDEEYHATIQKYFLRPS